MLLSQPTVKLTYSKTPHDSWIMKTYALLNQKGGSGKTVSTISLGAVLAKRGFNVLLVDLDPQGSLSRWIQAKKSNMADLLEGSLPPAEVVEHTAHPRLEVAGADRSLSRVESMRARRLAKGLKKLLVAGESHYDYVLIDPPPSTGPLVLASLLAVDGVVAPVQAALSAVDGLGDTLQLMRRVQKRVEGAKLVGAFACRVDVRTRSDQQVPDLLKRELGDQAFNTYIRETVKVREAESARVPPPLYDAQATAAEDYESLTDELISYEQS